MSLFSSQVSSALPGRPAGLTTMPITEKVRRSSITGRNGQKTLFFPMKTDLSPDR
jgi:hypothetical protein